MYLSKIKPALQCTDNYSRFQVESQNGNQYQAQEFSAYKDEGLVGNEPLFQIPPTQMSKPLHKNIVALLWKNNFSVGRGSGLLISKNLVLTSAHNFYHKGLKISQDLFQIFPGQCGIINKSYRIQKCFIPRQYLISPTNLKVKYDFSLIKLTQEVQQATDFIELNGTFIFNKNEPNIITILGYPDQSYKKMGLQEDIYSLAQWGVTKKHAILLLRQNKGEILHLVSTKKGQSGSPIILKQGEKLSVIGIHKGGVTTIVDGQEIEANSGRWLNKQLIKILKSEAQKMQADMFKVIEQQNEFDDSLSVLRSNSICKKKKKEYKNKQPFLSSGNFKRQGGIIQFYRKLIEINPKNSKAYYNIAQVLKSRQAQQYAIECYQKAIEINPKDSQSLLQLGISLQKINQYKRAISCYQKLIQIDPYYSQAYINLGQALVLTKKIDHAIQCFRKLININPNYYRGYLSLGNLYYNMKKTQDAISCYCKVVEITQQNYQAYFKLGQALDDTNKMDEAKKCYRKAININRKDSRVYLNLGNLYYKQNQQVNAIQCYRKVIYLDPSDSDAYLNLGHALDDLGELYFAVQYYRAATKINPHNSEAYYYLGNSLYKCKRVREAVECYRKAIQINPKNADAYCNLGAALDDLDHMNKKEQVIKCYRTAIQIEPKNSLTHNNLGTAYQKSEDMQSALLSYYEAVQLDPQNQTISKNFNRAMDHFRKINLIPIGFESLFNNNIVNEQ